VTHSIDELSLADWRRQMADLYAEVRRLATTDPGTALAHWRRVREHLFRTHPDSPVLRADRAAFVARHFPADPAQRFEVVVTPAWGEDGGAQVSGLSAAMPGGAPSDVRPISLLAPSPTAALGAGRLLELPTSSGGGMTLRRLGWVEVPFPAGTRRLAVYWMEGYAGGLFLPFRDATNGTETYGAGRYLIDAAKSADLGGDVGRGTVILDFNFAYQPSCAFDPRWACPLAPRENWLDIQVRAGERMI